MRWLVIFVLTACTRPTTDAPATPPPVLATITPSPSPAPSPDLDTDESTVEVADLCPDEPGRTGHGCSDDDEILAGDRCPGEPETVNDFEDADGCPDPDPPHVVRLHALARAIKFPTTRRSMPQTIKLDARATAALREAAEILRAHPHLALQISAHTDDRSDRGFTRVSVTARRARAIRDFLVDAGVDAMHLEANGHGPDEPIASNATAAGRASNRRVEFAIRILPVPDDPPSDPAITHPSIP